MTDANRQIETVYDKNGTPVKVTRLNAHDLTRTGTHTWKQPNVAPTGAEFDAMVQDIFDKHAALKAAQAAVDEDAGAAEATDEAPEGADVQDDLEFTAELVAGTDAKTYLEGFSVEALKTIAEETYGLRLRANVSKETAISKIIEAEAERTPVDD